MVAVLFICCMVSLIASLIALLRDINLSLAALKLELNRRHDAPRKHDPRETAPPGGL